MCCLFGFKTKERWYTSCLITWFNEGVSLGCSYHKLPLRLCAQLQRRCCPVLPRETRSSAPNPSVTFDTYSASACCLIDKRTKHSHNITLVLNAVGNCYALEVGAGLNRDSSWCKKWWIHWRTMSLLTQRCIAVPRSLHAPCRLPGVKYKVIQPGHRFLSAHPPFRCSTVAVNSAKEEPYSVPNDQADKPNETELQASQHGKDFNWGSVLRGFAIAGCLVAAGLALGMMGAGMYRNSEKNVQVVYSCNLRIVFALQEQLQQLSRL